MAEHKVEHVSSGEIQEFSAIKGKGHSGIAPSKKNYEDKPAICSVLHKGE